MSKYDKIRTKYVRNKLKQAGVKDKDYIDVLIAMEQWLHGEIYGMYVGSAFDKYPKEWKAINMELRPKEYKEEQKEEARLNKAVKEIDLKEQMEAQRELREWRKAAGELP